VATQVFNEFNARSIGDDANIFRGLARNPWFQCIIVFTVIVQYLIVQVRGGGTGGRKGSNRMGGGAGGDGDDDGDDG
jgi:hypothetical protein